MKKNSSSFLLGDYIKTMKKVGREAEKGLLVPDSIPHIVCMYQ